MAEKEADDGWQVVTSRKRKPSAAKDDQITAANKSSGTVSKGHIFLPASAPKSPVSSASESKGPATSSKFTSKDPDTSISPESERPDISLPEFVSSPASGPLVQAASDASPTTPLSAATGIQGHSPQTLQLSSGGAISPTKSHGSTESTSADDGFVTAQQTPEPSMAGDTKILRASPSSSDSYDSAEEGEVLSHQEHEPSETESFEGLPAIVIPQVGRETPLLPSPISPDTVSPDQTTPKAIQVPKRRVASQAQSKDTRSKHQESSPVSKDTNKDDEWKTNESKDLILSVEGTTHLASEQPRHPPTTLQESEAVAESRPETVIDYAVGLLGHTVAKDTIHSDSSPSNLVKDKVKDKVKAKAKAKDKHSSPSSTTLPESNTLDIDPTSITTASTSLDPTPLDIDPTSITTTSTSLDPTSVGIDLTSSTASSTPLDPTSLDIDSSATAASSSSATMSTPPKQTASGPTQDAPQTKDEETTPKPKFAQLASIPESEESEATTATQSATMTPIPRRATSQVTSTVASSSSSSSSRRSPAVAVNRPSEFANFTNAVNLPEIGPQELLTSEEFEAVVPRMSAHERSLTGTNIVTTSRAAAAVAASSRPSLPPRSPQLLTPPPPRTRGSRRSHAIPIRAPLPQPGFARPAAPLQPYNHGIPGIPSHYIPMYGPCHGMFFDPVTRMFVGDGPPRSTPRRADGSFPGTTQAQFAAELAARSQQPVNPEDALHVQPAGYADSVGAAAEREAQTEPVRPRGVAPTSAPTRPFTSYFCRCTGRWLPQRHNCPEPRRTPLPSGQPILPGTVLPRSWYTHELIIDASIYPGGVIPELGSEAAMTTSAVGGGAGEPAERWFAPAVAGPVASGSGAAPGGVAATAAGVAGGEGSSAGAPAETQGAAGEAGGKKKKRRPRNRAKGKGKGKEREGGEGPGEGQGGPSAGVV